MAILRFFPCLQIDQFTFSPKGYSLNAIAQDQYLTIHITPEKLSTYLSLESSFATQKIRPLINHLYNLFQPQHSNLMNFLHDPDKGLEIAVSPLVANSLAIQV